MIDTYEICKEINKKYGRPAVPKDYTGQFEVGCRVYQEYGDRIYFKGGNWYFHGDEEIYVLGYIGNTNPYWPAYQYNSFAVTLIKQGLVPEDYLNG
ncbi:MAG: hypothetical protein EYR95_18610 [Phormidium sp. SL48-SHIP]|nr:MAG: hypothetical protein EYR95_18610 [Phormidium sp. SL48-SHIP]